MGQEKYQVIESEERYFIVDKDASGFQKKVTPNLIESEVKIIRLNAQNCPLKVNCIELEGKPGEEVSSSCKNMGNYHYIRATVPCRYNGYHELDLLKLIPDPVSVKAKFARTRFLPSVHPIKKSHAHLVCKK